VCYLREHRVISLLGDLGDWLHENYANSTDNNMSFRILLGSHRTNF
jgi:hypothetical protein